MELAELLRTEHPAIAAEARSAELRRRYGQVRHIGGHGPGLDGGPSLALAVLAPFVGVAVRSPSAGATA